MPCTPVVKKNLECKLTPSGLGLACNALVVKHTASLTTRQFGEWIDFSSDKEIQCVMAAGAQNEGPVDVEVVLINNAAAREALRFALESATRAAQYSFACPELLGCEMRDEQYHLLNYTYGSDFTYTGARMLQENAASFEVSATPTVSSVYPDRALPGSVIEVRGEGFLANLDVPVDDNFYLSEWGYFDKAPLVYVNFGIAPCFVIDHNDTYLTCIATERESFVNVLTVAAWVHGKGFAYLSDDVSFTYDAAIDAVTDEPT